MSLAQQKSCALAHSLQEVVQTRAMALCACVWPHSARLLRSTRSTGMHPADCWVAEHKLLPCSAQSRRHHHGAWHFLAS